MNSLATALATALIGFVLLGNLVASVQVLRTGLYSRAQKLAQIAIVWLVPILGAVGIWAFLRAQYDWKKYDTRAYPETSEKMVVTEIDVISHGGSGEQ